MKLDVLDGLDRIGIVKEYRRKDGKAPRSLPSSINDWEDVEPITEYFDGWQKSVKGIKKWGDLPTRAQKYIRAIEEFIGTPVAYVSTGPERETGLLMPGSCLDGLISI
jgi:adenylosuccinate synthase